jgi:hypothetical protein
MNPDDYDRWKVAGCAFIALFSLAIWGLIAKVVAEAFRWGR